MGYRFLNLVVLYSRMDAGAVFFTPMPVLWVSGQGCQTISTSGVWVI